MIEKQIERAVTDAQRGICDSVKYHMHQIKILCRGNPDAVELEINALAQIDHEIADQHHEIVRRVEELEMELEIPGGE